MRLIRALILVIGAATIASAETTLAQYLQKLDVAVSRMGVLFDEDRTSPADAEIIQVLDDVRRLLPAKLDVSLGKDVITADNTALIKALEGLRDRYRGRLGSLEDRHDELIDLASQLNLLRERVEAASEQTSQAVIDKERLTAILARDEFRPEVREESRLYRWTRQLWNGLLRFLERFFLTREKATPRPGRASLDVVRALIAVGLVVALGSGSILLLKRFREWRRKRRGEEQSREVREILGEVIPPDATSEDLLANASELAHRGDYRGAIRKAFIALLVELDQRGKLRLDPAKTNHDYLNEVATDLHLVEPVNLLTSVFERVWYGQKSASSAEYVEFVERWRGAVRSM